MKDKNKMKKSDYDSISLSNSDVKLPLAILGLTKIEKMPQPIVSISRFYRTSNYHTVMFHKPISKIFDHDAE